MCAVLYYVETLRFFKVSLCVVPVLWCVRNLNSQKSPRCGLCAVVCEDFEFSSSHLCGLYAVACEDFEFSKFPCMCELCAVACEDSEFSKFPRVWADWALCYGV